MIIQLWGPVFDLVGDGGFKAFTFSWFTLKYGNVIEMILVVLIFVVGMFINLPGGKTQTPEGISDERPRRCVAHPGQAG